MTLSTNTIISAARKKLLEEGGEILSDTTMLIYANLAQDDIGKRAFPNSRIKTATVSFSAGVGTLPTNFGTLYGDAYTATGNNHFPELSIEDFNKKTLSQAVTIENGTIKVHPDTTGSLEIKYYEAYPTMTTVVNPTIDGYFHELIIYGIVFRGFEDLQDYQLAQTYEAKYEKELAKKIAVQSNFEENNVRGGQMFNQQDLIGNNGGYGSPNFF
jgi:hypothetical protein